MDLLLLDFEPSSSRALQESDVDQPWEYLGLLNECIKILLTIGLGWLLGYCRVFEASKFVPQATNFVFNIALPCLAVAGLGIGIDFYSDTILWNFIGAFLVLRGVALVVSLLLVIGDRKKGIGFVAVYWLCFTWISTVILGVPISGAVFGDPKLGLRYGILAGVSSFIFQLPVQLFFLECHRLEQDSMLGREIENRAAQDGEGKDVEDGSVDVEEIEAVPQHKEGRQQVEEQKHSLPRVPSLSPDTTTEDTAISFSVWIGFVKRRDIWMKILVKIVHNPVLWAIAVGFILTLSTAGPRFLNPSSPDYIYGLGWIFITLSWFGDCVSPLSLFAMGIWMQREWRTLFSIPIWSAILYMTAKLILVPMVGSKMVTSVFLIQGETESKHNDFSNIRRRLKLCTDHGGTRQSG